MTKPVCVVAGVGVGLGAALARRFSKGGYQVAALARRPEALEEAIAGIADCRALPCDVTDSGGVSEVYRHIRGELGAVEVLLYNAGSGVWGTVDELSPDDLTTSWQTNCLGLFLAAKQVVPGMREAGSGVIGITGATAALRGRPMTTAFAAAKAAQRSLAQSLARDLGPQGVHVFYTIIDGVIDLPRTRERLPDKADDFFLKPDEIAETYWSVATQRRSAWTFEVDVRPYGESW